MTAIETLAGFLAGTEAAALPPESVTHAKLHLLDTLAAMLAGPQTPDGVAIGQLAQSLSESGKIPMIGYSGKSTLLPAVMAGCAAARCTEIDDIHLESCTTPGSVIVPTALALAQAGYFTNAADLLAGVVLGYELLIRLGMAVNGPVILYQGIWPTCLTAGLGSAAVASRALQLDSRQAAGALATALAMSSGVGTRVKSGLSSRWVTLGVAAQNGVMAAFSARAGFLGNNAFLDAAFGKVHGFSVSSEKLFGNLGRNFLIDRTGCKPYPVGRQALAAVEGLRAVMAQNRIDPETIERISVGVPRRFVAMIDHREMPEDRMGAVRSVQYQMALAAFAPDLLYDVQRERVLTDDRIKSFMEKIHIAPAAELEEFYPALWPARVEIAAGQKQYAQEMLHPPGDPGNFFWEEGAAKFAWVTKVALPEAEAAKATELIRTLETPESLPALLALLGNHRGRLE